MVRINATLPDRLISLLDEEADGLEISRSELLRRVLDHHFRNEPPGFAALTKEERKRWNKR